ncbi:hypothetical protein EZV62_005413 [Acer yangbiense]|uniref:Uncharacterized protein n=1 Tax=Acer yangbiense TaxID=1000413 RepID=A0A5C7IN01_9ROSI|nr:hypothetical protein EZV62_005413 [Acer yangbiense]
MNMVPPKIFKSKHQLACGDCQQFNGSSQQLEGSYTLAMAANYVSAQGSDMALAPAPSMVTGTGFSLPISGAIIGFSLFFSLLAILNH